MTIAEGLGSTFTDSCGALESMSPETVSSLDLRPMSPDEGSLVSEHAERGVN